MASPPGGIFRVSLNQDSNSKGESPPLSFLRSGLTFPRLPSLFDLRSEAEGSETRHVRFEKLIEDFTSETTDASQFAILLLTYRSFSTPHQLWAKLIERYSEAEAKAQRAVMQRVFQFIHKWIQLNPSDMDDSSLMMQVHEFAERRLSPSQKQSIQQAIAGLMVKGAQDVSKQQRFSLSGSSSSKKLSSSRKRPVTHRFSATVLAQYLTNADANLLVNLSTNDLLGSRWTSARPLPPSLHAIVAQFNKIVNWVLYELLMDPVNVSQQRRQQTLEFFIALANELSQLNNFASGFAVWTALQNKLVLRLLPLWRDLKPESRLVLHDLAMLFQPLREWAAIRTRLEQQQQQLSSGSASSSPRHRSSSTSSSNSPRGIPSLAVSPVIPFIGMYLPLLLRIEQLLPDPEKNVINLNRLKMTCTVLEELRALQQNAPHFSVEAKAQTKLTKRLSAFENVDTYELLSQSMAIYTSAKEASAVDSFSLSAQLVHLLQEQLIAFRIAFMAAKFPRCSIVSYSPAFRTHSIWIEHQPLITSSQHPSSLNTTSLAAAPTSPPKSPSTPSALIPPPASGSPSLSSSNSSASSRASTSGTVLTTTPNPNSSTPSPSPSSSSDLLCVEFEQRSYLLLTCIQPTMNDFAMLSLASCGFVKAIVLALSATEDDRQAAAGYFVDLVTPADPAGASF